jgi:folylpolyglutamate synthase
LIFSHVSEQRDAAIVLEHLATSLSTVHIHHVIFTLYDPAQDFDSDSATGKNISLIVSNASAEFHVAVIIKSEGASQKAFGEIWERFHQNSRISYEPNIQKALDSARKIGTEARGMQTLITGSQHLVGAALFSFNNYAPVKGSA